MGFKVGTVTEWRKTSLHGYLVDASGRVLGPKGGIRKLKLTKGYPSFSTRSRPIVYVHTLVCEAFHGPRPDELHQVAHWNGDRQDNRAENLRWATPRENTDDARRHGTFPLRPGGAGEENGHARLTWKIVDAIRTEAACGVAQRALARKYGIGKSQVHNIVARKQWIRREEWTA
jgi:hypothetical protein